MLVCKDLHSYSHCDTDVCVGCTADGAGGRVEVCVVSGRRTVRVEEEQGDGEEKRQRLPEAAPAGTEERAAPAGTAAGAAEGSSAVAAAAAEPAAAAPAAAAEAALAAETAVAVAVVEGIAAAAGGPGKVDGQGGEGRRVRSRKAKRKRLSAPS